MVDSGFVKAWSDNLPKVDAEMVATFFANNPDHVSAEMRGTKATRASRRLYGDDAIGFVQVKGDGDLCTVKAGITPENRVRNPDYHVTVVINETEQTILSAECTGCVASRGRCQHSVASVFWLHLRSMEPAVTSKPNYWKALKLSKSVRGKAFVKSSDLGNKALVPLPDIGENFKEFVINTCLEMDCKAMICNISIRDETLASSSLYYLGLAYEGAGGVLSPQGFYNFCKAKTTKEFCAAVEVNTRNQAKTPLWNELRFGRITASKAFEVSRCQTVDGSLTEVIMGAGMPLKVEAVTRGRELEHKVLEVVDLRMDLTIEKCGICLDPDFPLFGASADGVTQDLCFKVKCPAKASTVENFIKHGQITSKPYAQMQLQMHLSKRKKCMFCIASPQFEVNNKASIIEIIV